MERAIGCLRDRLLIRLLFRLGCRVSEILALKVNDIDFERGTVTVLHLKMRIRLSCSKCKARLGKRHQFCPECGEEVSEAQKRQHDVYYQESGAASRKADPSNLLERSQSVTSEGQPRAPLPHLPYRRWAPIPAPSAGPQLLLPLSLGQNTRLRVSSTLPWNSGSTLWHA